MKSAIYFNIAIIISVIGSLFFAPQTPKQSSVNVNVNIDNQDFEVMKNQARNKLSKIKTDISILKIQNQSIEADLELTKKHRRKNDFRKNRTNNAYRAE